MALLKQDLQSVIQNVIVHKLVQGERCDSTESLVRISKAIAVEVQKEIDQAFRDGHTAGWDARPRGEAFHQGMCLYDEDGR